VASISYDSAATLKRFSDAYKIEYPMLSDKGSAVIRKYGILNTNIPEGHPFFGIPFPGDYLIDASGVVRDKEFMPNYETRPAASEVLLKNFGVAGAPAIAIDADDVKVTISMSSDRAVPGRELGVSAAFEIPAGWHIYGQPLPDNYVATSVEFDSETVSAQSFDFPKAIPVEFKSLGETLPVYAGSLRAFGRILVRSNLKPGAYKLKGTLRLQECSDQICKLPQKIAFEIPIAIDAMVAGAK
jgi:AhpC/TSA family protein/cytochrome c biogenesis DsbD-like protein